MVRRLEDVDLASLHVPRRDDQPLDAVAEQTGPEHLTEHLAQDLSRVRGTPGTRYVAPPGLSGAWWLSTQAADVVRGQWTAPEHGRETVEAWAQRWRRSVVHLKASSLARLDATLHEHVLPRWGDVPLASVTNAAVRGWLADLLADGMSASSARKAVHVLRRILASAVADRRIPYNPADDVPLPSDTTGEQRFLTADQVDDLADAMAALLDGHGRRYRALVLTAAFGGLRFGELAPSAVTASTSSAAASRSPRRCPTLAGT